MKVKTRVSDYGVERDAWDAVHESDLRFRELAEHVQDVLWLRDSQSREMLYVNPAFQTVFGCDCESVYDDSECWLNAVHPEDRDSVRKWHEGSTCAETWDIDYRILTSDGEIRWLNEQAFPVCDPTGHACRIAGVTKDTTTSRSVERQLADYGRRLRELAGALDQAADTERRRLAAGLHDGVSQNLALIRMQLGRLAMESPQALQPLVSAIDAVVEETIGLTRGLTFDLSPPALYQLGLWPAIEWLAGRMEQAGVRIECYDDCADLTLSERTSSVLFRVVRELLCNTIRHSEATVTVVSRSKVRNRMVLEVRDDGTGFVPPGEFINTKGGMGLLLAWERMQSLNGTIEIDSEPGQGTRVILTLPCNCVSQ